MELDLYLEDYIFNFFCGFIIALVICSFSNMPGTGLLFIKQFMETYVIVLIFLFPIYMMLKSREIHNFSYLVQEKIYIVTCLFIIGLALFFLFTYLYDNKNTSNGIIMMMIAIFLSLVIVLIYIGNSAITTRYNLNSQSKNNANLMNRYK